MGRRHVMDAVSVANFVASMPGLVRHEAYENARADAKSYGWNDATLKAVIDAIASSPPGTFAFEYRRAP